MFVAIPKRTPLSSLSRLLLVLNPTSCVRPSAIRGSISATANTRGVCNPATRSESPITKPNQRPVHLAHKGKVYLEIFKERSFLLWQKAKPIFLLPDSKIRVGPTLKSIFKLILSRLRWESFLFLSRCRILFSFIPHSIPRQLTLKNTVKAIVISSLLHHLCYPLLGRVVGGSTLPSALR